MKHKHHIIPKHMGGSDDPSNIKLLTPEEHAEAHRLLYVQYGCWQDYVAWLGLAKLVTKEEHVKILLSEAGKRGNAIRNSKGGNKGMKYNMDRVKSMGLRKGQLNSNAKEYLITHPNKKQERIKSLKTWCESKNITYKNFHKQCIRNKKEYQSYKAELC